MKCATRRCQKQRADAVNGINQKTRMCAEHMELYDRWRDEDEADRVGRRLNRVGRWF